MDYQLCYEKLVSKCVFREIDVNVKYEIHHILPRSMGGGNNKENLVFFTPREHYFAHWLLWKIHKNSSMTYAFWCMSHTRGGKINSKTYEKLRTNMVEKSIERMADPEVRKHLSEINMNHSVSIEARNKISAAHSGKIQPREYVEKRRISVINSPKSRKGKSLEDIYGDDKAAEMKANLSEINTGKKQSVETIAKRTEKLIGHECIDETRDKISKANTGKVRTAKQRKNISEGHTGLKQSEETKKKKSIALKNRAKSEKHKAKMRKPKSEEHKRKISETKQRKKLEKLILEESQRNV